HLSVDEIGHHCLQALVLAAYPMVLDHHVLAFGVASFVKAFAEGAHKMRDDLGRPDVDESDHRWYRLLAARRERPTCCRAAEERDELAAFHAHRVRASRGAVGSGSVSLVARLRGGPDLAENGRTG